MGAEWDRDLPSQRIFDECLRILKPGGHIFVMSSERLDCIAGFYHLLANAGFEVDNHQLIGWLTLSGMPKSSDVAKTADKEAFRAWLAMHRETVTCPDHKEPIDPVTKERQRCAECERIFLTGKLTRHDQRKAESAAVNGDGDVTAYKRPAKGARGTTYSSDGFGANPDRDMPLLTRLLASHWPASPAEQRAHWEACVAEVPEEWDCSRPPGVRVKTGEYVHPGLGADWVKYPSCCKEYEPEATWGRDDTGRTITAPSTPDAVRFDGWRGSVAPMKPMLAPILHACKPWRGSYLDCARESGGGVLNVEAGRIPFADGQGWGPTREMIWTGGEGGQMVAANPNATSERTGRVQAPAEGGRVPGNLLSYADLLTDLQRYADLSAWCKRLGLPEAAAELLEAGLVYSPKPSRAEKSAGLEEFPECDISEVYQGGMNGASIPLRGSPPPKYRNVHPTCKPTALCAYLVALCTRDGETVLDPFCGSGSTGVAAALLKRRFVGVELSEDFAAIARARIAHAASAADDTPAQESAQPALMEVPA